MIELASPWMLLLLPLPILIYRFLPAYQKRKSSVQVPFFQRLVDLTGEVPSSGVVVLKRLPLPKVWLLLTWILLIIALSKPEMVGDPIVTEKSARDLMVAVDLSGSMAATDFVNGAGEQVDRLTAVKSVLTDFSQRRSSDRLGLIVFGDAPFLQSPFTLDHQTWLTLLNETEIGMAGMSTAFGDAIGLSLKLFAGSDSDNKVLIVLTDGNDTGSKVPPIEAAKVAQQYNTTIYTIAIGDPETSGEEALDTEVLARIAELTGGAYYQALDREQLQQIYQEITRLEPELYDSYSYRPRQSLYHYPVLVVVSGSILLFTIGALFAFRRQRLTRRAESQ
jgi:Ca-activated chloride channel family protein